MFIHTFSPSPRCDFFFFLSCLSTSLDLEKVSLSWRDAFRFYKWALQSVRCFWPCCKMKERKRAMENHDYEVLKLIYAPLNFSRPVSLCNKPFFLLFLFSGDWILHFFFNPRLLFLRNLPCSERQRVMVIARTHNEVQYSRDFGHAWSVHSKLKANIEKIWSRTLGFSSFYFPPTNVMLGS